MRPSSVTSPPDGTEERDSAAFLSPQQDLTIEMRWCPSIGHSSWPGRRGGHFGYPGNQSRHPSSLTSTPSTQEAECPKTTQAAGPVRSWSHRHVECSRAKTTLNSSCRVTVRGGGSEEIPGTSPGFQASREIDPSLAVILKMAKGGSNA